MHSLLNYFSSTLQTVNFTEPFYARPVVLVTPKHSDNNNNSNLSGSRCNAVTAWVEVRNTCCTLFRDVARIFSKGGSQSEGTHQIVMALSPPVVGWLLEKRLTKGWGVTGTPKPP